MGTLAEVDLAVRAIRENGNPPCVLLHCTTNYPSAASDANLRAIGTLRDAFGLEVGYSDHTQTETCAVAAVALGARVIEKHFTLDRGMEGPDHTSAADPAQFVEFVRRIRETESALGDGVKVPCAAEIANMPNMRRSLVAKRDNTRKAASSARQCSRASGRPTALPPRSSARSSVRPRGGISEPAKPCAGRCSADFFPNLAVYFSSGAFRGQSPESMLLELAGYPGTGLEFTAGLDPRDNWDDCFRQWRDEGTPLLVHNYFPPPVKPFVLNWPRRTTRFARQASPSAAKPCGSPRSPERRFSACTADSRCRCVRNSSATMLRRPESAPADRDAAAGTFVETVRDLATEAVALGIRLLLENNVVSEAHRRSGLAGSLFLSIPENIEDFFAEWTDLPVGLLLDVGHARVTGETLGVSPEEFFDRLSGRIEALHLSDNDGLADSNRPFTRDAWFLPHLARHSEKAAVIEVYGLDAAGRREQWDLLISNFKE